MSRKASPRPAQGTSPGWSALIPRLDEPDAKKRDELIDKLGADLLPAQREAAHRKISELAQRYRLDRNISERRPQGAQMIAALETTIAQAAALADTIEGSARNTLADEPRVSLGRIAITIEPGEEVPVSID